MSTASQTMRDTTRDAREDIREVGAAANAASGDIAKDLQALRNDFSRLTEQIGEILANKGNAAWRRAKSRVDGVMSDAQAKGQEAVGSVREVSDRFVDAIDDSISKQPYTVLAIALGIGFLFGATWRR
jgi:ElaB/YqjD/DUF883 family membrane-anchored ribosome-binding protein